MMRKWWSIAPTVVLLLALLVASPSSIPGTALSAPQNVEILLPEVLAALQEQAFVVTDPYGVPHIYAKNTHDLYVVTGYIQARDRLFQMDFVRHQASGTLAELLGPAALESDVQMRTLGIRRAAKQSLSVMSPEVLADAQAFADGVNAFIEEAQANGKLPPEYALLEISRVEPWTVVDSLVVGKAIVFDQSLSLDSSRTLAFLAYMTALSQVGLDGAALFFEDLFRSAPAEPAAVIPDAQGASQAQTTSPLRRALEGISPTTLKLLVDYFQKIKDIPFFRSKLLGDLPGSNWFVISGEHTQSGFPIIANDPHLSLTNPAVWYEMHQVVEGELDVAGVTLPGIPYVLLGCTRRVCWTPTTNPLDVTDMFSEKIVQDENGRLFSLFRGELEPIQVLPERYRVNIVGDGVMDNLVPAPPDPKIPQATLIIPRHGPVVSLDLEAGEAVSIQFTGFYATREIETFRIWDRAQNIGDFQEGLKFFDVGTFNWGYADVDGNIAYFTSSEVPLREDLEQGFVDLIPPFFVRDGTGTLQHQWIEEPEPGPDQALPFKILPPEEMPHIINPPAGFIVNANNDPIGTTLDNDPLNQLRPTGGIYYLNYSYDPGYRAARLTELIRDKIERGEKISVQDAMDFLADTTMLAARRLTPFLLGAIEAARSPEAPEPLKAFLKDPRLTKAAEVLSRWSFDTPTGLTEGFDRDKPPGVPPTPQQVNDSVATTIFHLWLSQLIKNTVDAVLNAISPQLPKPGNHDAVKALIHLLEDFEASGGVGASGLPFFNVPGLEGAPAELKRDIILLKSLEDALDLLGGDAFASAFNGSKNLDDYRWGKIHRVTLRHLGQFGGPFDLPPEGGFPTDGGYQVPDRSDPNVRGTSPEAYGFHSGPSRRFVAELDPKGIKIFQVLPGGQSGVLGARHYGDQLTLWLADRFHPLVTDKLEVFQTAESWQDFFPLYRSP